MRDIPAADDLLAVLSPLCSRDPSEPLLTNRGRQWSTNQARTHLREAAQAAGLDGLTPHRLRHYYASALITAGVPVTGVQATLGHASPAITLNVYTHLWPGVDDVTRRAAAGLVSGAGPVRDRGGAAAGGGPAGNGV